MDKNKISFITAVNEERTYKECLYYIENLIIPKNYSIECIGIRNAKSMMEAYNKACKKTNAKYKIYIHQDVLIINNNFINNILEIFNDNAVGMIGVCGAKNMPKNGMWWESDYRIGKVYESSAGKMKLLELGELNEIYESVQVVDGLIMITQYDIEWKNEVFDGWHFYDLSQSFEYTNRGYKVVIPKQNEPWCIHDCGLVNTSNGFNEYKEKFVKMYLG